MYLYVLGPEGGKELEGRQFPSRERRSERDRRFSRRRGPCRGIQPGRIVLRSSLRRSPTIRLPTPLRLGPLRRSLESEFIF